MIYAYKNNFIKFFCDNTLQYQFFFVVLHPLMNRLVIHKNVTPKTLFRVLGGSIYKEHHWDIASNKNEVVAYLTQFLPDIITIGPLEDMTPTDVAIFLRDIYRRVKNVRYPKFLCVDPVYRTQVETILQRNKSNAK